MAKIPEDCPINYVGVSVNPMSLLKKVATMIVALTVVFTAFTWAGDTRYATKEEVRAAQELILTKMDYTTDQSRKTALDDKIYELQQIPEVKRTNEQRALLDRYQRQFQELNARWVNPPPGVRQHKP